MWAVLYRAAVTSVDVVWAVAVAVAFVSPKLQHTRNLCLSVYVSVFFIRQKNSSMHYWIVLGVLWERACLYRFWITGYFCLWTRIRWNCEWSELKLFAHWTDNAKSIQLLFNKKNMEFKLGAHVLWWLKLNGELPKPFGALNCTMYIQLKSRWCKFGHM